MPSPPSIQGARRRRARGPSAVDTTRGPLWRRSIQLAIPAVIQAVLVNCYAFNDFLFIGLSGDEAATAALSACFAFVVLANTLVGVVPTGAMSMMAQAFGAGDRARVAQLTRTATVSAAVGSALVGLIALAMMGPIVSAANAAPAVSMRIDEYMSVLCGALVSFGLMRAVTSCFYACGDTRTPLVLEGLSLVVNTLLNWLLVLGPGPLPAMGIEGAAIATVCSRALPALGGLWRIAKGSLGIELRPPSMSRHKAWWPVWPDLAQMIRVGFFASVSGALYGLVYLVLNRMAGEIGPAAQGGLGAGLRGIEWIAFAFGDGFLTASVAIVGQNIGAGKLRRALRGAWFNALASAASCQIVGISFLVAPRALSALVTDDPATLEFAARYIEVLGWVMWAVGLEMSMYGALIGAGWTATALVISGLNNLCRIPIAAALVFGLPAIVEGTAWATLGLGQAPAPLPDSFDGLPLAIAVTAVIKAACMIAFFLVRGRRLPLDREDTTF